MSRWEMKPLESLTETPITYGVVKPGPEDKNGVKFIRGGDINAGRVLIAKLRTITQEVSQAYSRTLLNSGELLVSLVGNPGQVAIVPPELRHSNIARQVGLVRLSAAMEPRFVKYYLLSPLGQESLGAQSLGSVQQVINLKDLKTLLIPVPPLNEQRRIADILGSLDDKIELNRQMNETLEAMARRLFKSWFVDFDPVHKKAAARREHPDWDNATLSRHALPNLHPEIAELFPEGFEESSLGMIPAGWMVNNLTGLANISSGKRPSVLLDQAPVPVFGGGGRMGFTDAFLFNEPVILTGRVGTLGKFFRAMEQCWPSDNCLVLQPIDNHFYFTYLSLLRIDLTELNRGSTQPLLSQGDLKRVAVLIAPIDVMVAFDRFTRSVFSLVDQNLRESQTLTQTRDKLLPLLLSGELRVEEVK